LVLFDPYSPAFAANPYPVYATLREGSPIFHDPAFGMTFLTRYRDIVAVLTDKRFGRVRPSAARSEARARDEGTERRTLPYYDRYVRVNLLETEGETHRRLRRRLAGALGPKRIADLSQRVACIAAEIVESLDPGTAFDFIAELAEPLPVIMISELLGWPENERHLLRPWSADIVRLYEKDTSEADAERAETATREFATMLDALATERKTSPRNDLISELAALESGDGDLTREQLISSCMLLLNAGHEATVNAAGNGLLALLRHPQSLQSLRAQPQLIDSAVEEMLRYDPPLHLFHRFATEDATVAGFDFRAGDMLGLLYGSANRDPDAFPDPDEFDIGRQPNRHLAFGAATHFCLGATLARLELRSLINALLTASQTIELLETQPEYRTGLVFRGLKRLTIRI
jgi:unspecific monooxygenase